MLTTQGGRDEKRRPGERGPGCKWKQGRRGGRRRIEGGEGHKSGRAGGLEEPDSIDGTRGSVSALCAWRAPGLAIPASGPGRWLAARQDEACGISAYQSCACQGSGQLVYTERRDEERNGGTGRGTRNGRAGSRDSMPGRSLQRCEGTGLDGNEVLHLAIVCDARATTRARYWASRVPRAGPDESGGGYTTAAYPLRTRVRGAAREYGEVVESKGGGGHGIGRSSGVDHDLTEARAGPHSQLTGH